MHTHGLSVLVACVVLQERVTSAQKGRILMLRHGGLWHLPSYMLRAGELPCDVAMQKSREQFGVTFCLDNLEQPALTLVEPGSCSTTLGRVHFFFVEPVYSSEAVLDRECPYGGEVGWYLPEKVVDTTPLIRFALRCLERRIPFAVVPDEFVD